MKLLQCIYPFSCWCTLGFQFWSYYKQYCFEYFLYVFSAYIRTNVCISVGHTSCDVAVYSRCAGILFLFFPSFPFIRMRQLGKEKHHPQCVTCALLWEVTNGKVFLKSLNSQLQIITGLFSPLYVLSALCILFHLILIRISREPLLFPFYSCGK